MRQALKQGMLYALSLLVMKGVSFLLLPFVASHLSTTEFGQLDVLLTWMNVLGLVAGLGIAEATFRYVGTAESLTEKARVAASGFWICGIAAALLWLVLGMSASFWLEILPGNITEPQFHLALASLCLSAVGALTLTWLRIIGRAGLFCVLSLGKACFHAGLTVVLLHQGYGIEGILTSSLIASAGFAAGSLLVQATTSGLRPNWQKTRLMLRYGWPLVISSLAVFLLCGSERWILAQYQGTESLAIYGLAMQFAMLVAFLCEPYTLWWFPKRFSLLGTGQLAQNAVFAGLGVIAAVWAALFLILFCPWVIRTLFPAAYHEAAVWTVWLIVGHVFKQASHILNLGCYTGNSTGLPTRINLALAVVAVPIYITATVAGGLAGLVGSVVLVYGLRMVVMIVASQKRLQLPYDWGMLSGHGVLLLGVALAQTHLGTLAAALITGTAAVVMVARFYPLARSNLLTSSELRS